MASTVSNGNDRSEKWQRPFQMATTVYEREISICDMLYKVSEGWWQRCLRGTNFENKN